MTEIGCNCPTSDAWRCAVARRASYVSCSCVCHRALLPAPRVQPTTRKFLMDEPVERVEPKSQFLLKLEAEQAVQERAATAPQKVVAIRSRRPPTPKK